MRLCLPLLVVLAVPACRTAAPVPNAPAGSAAEAAARQQQWAASGVRSYVYTLERQCFCTAETRGPFVVTVRDGRVADVRRLAGGMTPDGQPLAGALDTKPENRLTVDDLFALVRGAHRDGAARVNVTYDPRLGHPTRVWIDRDAALADEEIGYVVTNLRRL